MGKGVHYLRQINNNIRILEKLYPSIVKGYKSKIFKKPTLEYEYMENLSLIQKLFFNIKVKKDVEIQEVNLKRWQN